MFKPDEIIKEHQDKTFAVGVSGGKDSTAMALYLKELDVPNLEFHFCDTGWEHPLTYEYIDYLETKIGPITRIKPEMGMVELILKKKIFPSRRIRYCTQMLKIYPFQEHYKIGKKHPFREDLIMCTGERSEESPSRAGKLPFEKDTLMGCYMWRPIKEWAWQKVFEIAKKHDIKPNPLYMKGFKRVGCYPCVFANKPDYAAIAADPYSKPVLEKIRKLEKEIGRPWVQLQRVSGDIEGIDALLEWATDGHQEDIFEAENFSCSSHYKLCE